MQDTTTQCECGNQIEGTTFDGLCQECSERAYAEWLTEEKAAGRIGQAR